MQRCGAFFFLLICYCDLRMGQQVIAESKMSFYIGRSFFEKVKVNQTLSCRAGEGAGYGGGNLRYTFIEWRILKYQEI
jgi:hypothetical protein